MSELRDAITVLLSDDRTDLQVPWEVADRIIDLIHEDHLLVPKDKVRQEWWCDRWREWTEPHCGHADGRCGQTHWVWEADDE